MRVGWHARTSTESTSLHATARDPAWGESARGRMPVRGGGLHRAHRNGLGPAHSPGPAALPYVGGPGGPWPDPRGQGHLQAAAAPEDGLQGSPIDRKTRSRTRAHLKLHAAADEPWTRPLDMTLLCREARPDSLPRYLTTRQRAPPRGAKIRTIHGPATDRQTHSSLFRLVQRQCGPCTTRRRRTCWSATPRRSSGSSRGTVSVPVLDRTLRDPGAARRR